MAKLIAMTGPDAGTEYTLSGDTIIGRSDDADVVVASRKASRHHARIARSSRGWMIEDLHSHNGTTVNGRKIAKTVLRDAYQVVIGRIPYLFVESYTPKSRLGKTPAEGKVHRAKVIPPKKKPHRVPTKFASDAPAEPSPAEEKKSGEEVPEAEPRPASVDTNDEDHFDTDVRGTAAHLGEEPDPLLGATPLHVFSWHGDEHIVELLIANGADVNAKDNVGDTALHEAARGGHKDVAEMLISEGADVNAVNQQGSTPLHESAGEGREEVVRLLLANKANRDLTNADGHKPIDFARQNAHEKVVELLADDGAGD